MLKHFFKKFQTLSLSIRLGQGCNHIFCHFPPFFLQGFSLPRPVRPLYHSFCIYLHVSCIKSWDLGKILNLRIVGVFDDSTCFSWNWSMGFCSKTLYNCSWWFNLINLLFCEKLKFLGLEYNRFGDFVQIGFKWWNWLVGLIILIIMNYFLSCVMINWSMWYKLNKWFLKILGFCSKLYAQANFVILTLNWTYSHCIRASIMTLYYSCII